MLFSLWTLNHHYIISNLELLIQLIQRIRMLITLVDIINDKLITVDFHLLLRRTHCAWSLYL